MTRCFAGRVLLQLLAGLPMILPTAGHAAQEVALADQGPRFLIAPPAGGRAPVEVDASRIRSLRRKVSLDFKGVRLGEALDQIAERAGIRLVYVRSVLPLDSLVRFRSDSITVAAALTELLLGLQVDVLVSGADQVALVRSTGRRIAPGSLAGRVTDAKTGGALAGAEVLLEGTRWRTGTSDDGSYRLAEVAPGSYTLAVRRIGYAKQSQAVTVASAEEITVDVALQPVATQLDEIVTTVTGEHRLRELGHVVGRINADSVVREAPVTNVSELLTGRVTGLQVFQSQGTIGGKVQLQARGPNSAFLGTEPIVIIDGVRYTSQHGKMTTLPYPLGRTQGEATSPLNDINPNDLETVEVVKGPSAATLYGTDAANGVIVITTKRGRQGAPQWNSYLKAARTDIPRDGFPDNYIGWGDFGDGRSVSFCSLSYVGAGFCTQDSVEVRPSPLNRPELTIFGRAPRWESGVNVSGGRQDLRYYFSGSYEDAIGPVKMPDLAATQLAEQRGISELPDDERHPNRLHDLNLRANITALLGGNAELQVNTGYIKGDTRNVQRLNSPFVNGVAISTPTQPYGCDGGAPQDNYTTVSTERADRFIGSATGRWRATEWLQASATAGLDLGSRNRYSLSRRRTSVCGFLNEGSVEDHRVRELTTTANMNVTATKRLGRLSLRTDVGAQYNRMLGDGLFGSGQNLPPGGTSVSDAAQKTTFAQYDETVTLGSYVEQTVGINDRLFFKGALRVDGASAFGKNYDATTYPKVSASWIASEEPFFPRVPGLTELRLRYAYGASGQQPSPSWGRPNYVPTIAATPTGLTTVLNVDAVGNPNIRPERVREHEAGIDVGALADRLRLELSWYKRRTVDQIYPVSLPPGFGSSFTNIGLTTQHGFEADIAAQVLATRAVSLDVRVQHSLHRTKLVEIGEGQEFPTDQGGWAEGYPLGGRFVPQILGYSDVDGDGILEFPEIQRGEPVYIGESTPPITRTLSAVLGLFERRIRLSALVERRVGFVQFDGTTIQRCSNAQCREVVDPTLTLEEQLVPLTGGFYRTGDLTRLREVTLAIDLPVSALRPLRARSATMSLSGRNLALWSAFEGVDPESADVSGVAGGSIDGIPQGRTWTLRFDLGF